MKRASLEFLLVLIAGILSGLLYSWILSPLRYVDTTPDTLRADFKERYRVAIADAYAATGNLERARARLSLLGDPDPIQALSAQAQQMLAAGEVFETVRHVAQLASDLQESGEVASRSTSTPEFTTLPTNTPASAEAIETNAAPALTETIIPDQIIEPPLQPINSPTPRPTRTPTRIPGAPFQLTAQDTICDDNLTEGLLQIILMDSRRREMPGLEIVVNWTGGEDHFFTGFKPELGNGYADYVMQPDVVYSIRVAEGGQPVSNVSAGSCTRDDGTSYTGGIRLTFQQ